MRTELLQKSRPPGTLDVSRTSPRPSWKSRPDARLHQALQGNACQFATLDEAMEWAELQKLAWTNDGWSEVPRDTVDQ